MVPRRGTRRDMKPSNSAMYEDTFRALFFTSDKNVVTFVVTLAFSWPYPQNLTPGGKNLLLIAVILLACIKKCFSDEGSALAKFEGLALRE